MTQNIIFTVNTYFVSSVVFYKDVDQVVRLLRAIYRPQNYYCLHLDKKAPAQLHNTLADVTRCFDNVLVSHLYGLLCF